MTTVVAEIKALLAGARAAVGIIKRVDSSEALQARFDEAVQEVQREVGQICFAVCRALVADAIGRDPFADEVEEILSAAVNDPAFPNRAYRLLGEARKSASHRRRRFLAAMLFGLPFSKIPDDERDRIDMAVERMLPADADLLRLIVDKDRSARPSPEADGPYFFKGTNVLAVIRGIEVRVGSTDDWGADDQFGDDVYTDARFCVDHGAFAALLSFGLIDVGGHLAAQGDWAIHRLTITLLGRVVMRAIEEVRPGFDRSAVTVES
jgi:hypothetical protein